MRILLVIVLLLLSHSPLAELDERIKVVIEEPTQGGSYSGISNLRGYAISPEGMGSYYLEVYIDGEFAFYIAPYGNRPDVGNAFPDYPGSDVGGFSMAFNYKDLVPGEHEIAVRAFDNAINYNDAITAFTTERFVGPFIADDAEVDLSTIKNVFLNDSKSLLVNGAKIEGQTWDFLLSWDRASQSFKTERISPVDSLGSGSDFDSSGSNGNNWEVYACVTSPDRRYYSDDSSVRFKNGLAARNNEGDSWWSGNTYFVFKTRDSKWYVIREEEVFIRLDVYQEPRSCFTPEYGRVVGVSRSLTGDKILSLSGSSSGGAAQLDVYVSSSCPMGVGTFWTYYGTDTGDTSLVDLENANFCKVNEIVEL